MFERLFGETEKEQLNYLKWRAITTLIIFAILGVAFIISLLGINDTAATLGSFVEKSFAFIMIFIWGWGVIKSLFGITSIAAIFSGNLVIGILLFFLYIMLAYLAGLIVCFIGTFRYIYLKIKTK